MLRDWVSEKSLCVSKLFLNPGPDVVEYLLRRCDEEELDIPWEEAVRNPDPRLVDRFIAHCASGGGSGGKLFASAGSKSVGSGKRGGVSGIALNTNNEMLRYWRAHIPSMPSLDREFFFAMLSLNAHPIAVQILRERSRWAKLCWFELAQNANPDATYLVIMHVNACIVAALCQPFSAKVRERLHTPARLMPSAVQMAFSLNRNHVATEFLRRNPEFVCWSSLSRNDSEVAVALLLARPEKISWSDFCKNANDRAVDYLLQHRDLAQQHPAQLCANTNPRALQLLCDNDFELLLRRAPEHTHAFHLCWSVLSANASEKAMEILAANDPRFTRYHNNLVRNPLLCVPSDAPPLLK